MVVFRFVKDEELIVLAMASLDDQSSVELSRRLCYQVNWSKLKIFELDPEQALARRSTIAVSESTVMDASEDISKAQAPDCTTALSWVVVLRFEYTKDLLC